MVDCIDELSSLSGREISYFSESTKSSRLSAKSAALSALCIIHEIAGWNGGQKIVWQDHPQRCKQLK